MNKLDLPLRSPNDPDSRMLLEGTQGNILKFHSRGFARALFVSFIAQPKEVRQRLKALAAEFVTSAEEQARRTLQWKEDRRKGKSGNGEPFGMVALSWRGYRYIELTQYVPKDSREDSQYFEKGMQTAYVSPYGAYWNPDLDLWADEYRDRRLPIHLFVLLADDEWSRLRDQTLRIKGNIAKFGKIIAEERLSRQIHKFVDRDRPIEHFGFRDGISKPLFIESDSPTPREGFLDQSPVERLKRLFVAEPELSLRQRSHGKQERSQQHRLQKSLGIDPKKTYGSFLVVLKQEQNVWKFQQETMELARRLDVSHEEAQELCLGRRKDGSPLTHRVVVPSEQEGGGEEAATRLVTTLNDFNYSADRQGLRCPLHAHIRKVNPRLKEKELRPVIARRGMPYGPEREDLYPGATQSPPSEGVGLLFMSFQSDIGAFVKAFSATQKPVKQTGIDPITGRFPRNLHRTPELAKQYTQVWKKRDGTQIRFSVGDVIKPKGGEYFFAPSVYFLQHLDELLTDEEVAEDEQPAHARTAKAT